MLRKGLLSLVTVVCATGLVTRGQGQVVEVPRDTSTAAVSSREHMEGEGLIDREVETEPAIVAPAPKPVAPVIAAKPKAAAPSQPITSKLTIEEMRKAGALAGQKVKSETRPQPATTAPALEPKKSESFATRALEHQPHEAETILPQPINLPNETAFIRLADGFDFPVGKPDAQGYYRARGFRAHGHLGEDWDGVGGGDTDLGDPIYAIGDGVVVFARDCHMGWGNVVILRHAYRDSFGTRNIDSLYGHLQKIMVRRGQTVKRGEQIATLGNAHGLYDAHLHLEVRKNIEIGMSRAKFAQDFSNYYDPSEFILSHRHLQTGGRNYRVALNTFSQDARIPWDKLRNFSHAHTGGGSSESANALKKAVASQDNGR